MGGDFSVRSACVRVDHPLRLEEYSGKDFRVEGVLSVGVVCGGVLLDGVDRRLDTVEDLDEKGGGDHSTFGVAGSTLSKTKVQETDLSETLQKVLTPNRFVY